MTLLELLLATVVTVMVAGGIAGMLGAVSSGVGTRKDNREVMVRAHSAQCRIAAYIATARCVLAAGTSDIVLWLDDSRQSNTVHATEIRWIRFDATSGELLVEYVQFPETWTRTACELADYEYGKTQDWAVVHGSYQAKGLLVTRSLVDQLAIAEVHLDDPAPTSARQVAFALEFLTGGDNVGVQVSGTIQSHHEPVK